MNQTKLKKFIEARQKIYNFEAKQKKKLKPFEEKRKKIEATLQKYIYKGVNSDGEEGTQSVGLDNVICFAKESDKYSLIPEVGREQVNAHVVNPLHKFIADGKASEHAVALREIADEIEERLAIFKNEVVPAYCDNYRLETGGKKIPGKNSSSATIEGGDVPNGVQVYAKPTIHFNKR